MDQDPLQALQSLEQRITAKEHANLQLFQKEILQQLKLLRQTLLKEGKTSAPTATTDEKKDKRITELQNQNRRLEYRITHLTRNLRQALEKQ